MPISIPRLRIWFAMLADCRCRCRRRLLFLRAPAEHESFSSSCRRNLESTSSRPRKDLRSPSRKAGALCLPFEQPMRFSTRVAAGPNFATSALWFTEGNRIALTRFTVPHFEYDPKAGTVVAQRRSQHRSRRKRQRPGAARSGTAQGTAKSNPLKDQRLGFQPENGSRAYRPIRGIPRDAGRGLRRRRHL